MQMHVVLLSSATMYLDEYVESLRLRLVSFVRCTTAFGNTANHVISLRKRIILELEEVAALLVRISR